MSQTTPQSVIHPSWSAINPTSSVIFIQKCHTHTTLLNNTSQDSYWCVKEGVWHARRGLLHVKNDKHDTSVGLCYLSRSMSHSRKGQYKDSWGFMTLPEGFMTLHEGYTTLQALQSGLWYFRCDLWHSRRGFWHFWKGLWHFRRSLWHFRGLWDRSGYWQLRSVQ